MKFSKIRGITLTELLVAGILIGIVMIGVISVSFAIKKMQETTNKSALLAMRATSVVTHMTKNVAMAVGYKDDPGLVVGDDGSWVSVRKESGDDLSRFNDDTWNIYHYHSDTYKLYTCTQDAIDGPEPKTADCLENKSELLAADVRQAEFTLFNDPENYELYLAVHLETRYDPGQDMDLISNPEFILDSRMSPVGHSW